MALLGNFGDDYTKTGNGFLTSLANKLSFLGPLVNNRFTTFFATPLTALIGYADTALESVGWLLRGKPLSAMTVAAAGVVGNTVNASTGVLWWLNMGSGLTTGRTLGTHARHLTEELIGGATGVLGMQPTVLRSYTAGVGSIAAGAESRPGRWATQMTPAGQDPGAYYNMKMNGDLSQHAAELDSARAQPDYGRSA